MSGSNGNNGLGPEKRKALDVLLATGNQTEAAAAANVHDRTLRRWLASDPAFTQALYEAQGQALDSVTSALVYTSRGAVELLRETIDNENAKLPLRMKAAQIVLDACLRWHELRSLTQRIEALEEAQRGKA